ncbi:MAG: NAD-dependent epimerase/dehydratase family protein [Sphingomonas sp.]
MATLVTGAAGFIGYHLARRLLEAGETVIGIDNLNPYYDPVLKRDRVAQLADIDGDFDFREIDFSEHEALEDALASISFDRIAHLGAQPGVRYSLTHPRAYVAANLAGHLNLLEMARARQVRHFVYASSSSVYGGTAKLPFRIGDPVDHPVSLYAATKKADELMSETYAHLYRVPATGLRFFTVYGPWGRPDMATWTFTRKVLAGEPIQVFNFGKMRRDFTYVDDIVDGMVAALDRPPADDGAAKPGGSCAPHAIYNLGNNRSEQLLDMIAVIERACGREAVMEMLPLQAGDVVDTFADIGESRRDLGFEPKTGIETGLPIFVDWFREYCTRRPSMA